MARTAVTLPAGVICIDKPNLVAFGESGHRGAQVDYLSHGFMANCDCFFRHDWRGTVKNHLSGVSLHIVMECAVSIPDRNGRVPMRLFEPKSRHVLAVGRGLILSLLLLYRGGTALLSLILTWLFFQ